MKDREMMANPRCPKCQGTLILDDNFGQRGYPEYVCLNCGKRLNMDGKEVTVMVKEYDGDSFSTEEEELAPDSTGLPVPSPPSVKTRANLYQYYSENRLAILRDCTDLGVKVTMRRWGIKNRRTMENIRHNWPKSRISKVSLAPSSPPDREPACVKPDPAPPAFGMPVFPEFDKTWNVKIQDQWLRTYSELMKIRAGMKNAD